MSTKPTLPSADDLLDDAFSPTTLAALTIRIGFMSRKPFSDPEAFLAVAVFVSRLSAIRTLEMGGVGT